MYLTLFNNANQLLKRLKPITIYKTILGALALNRRRYKR